MNKKQGISLIVLVITIIVMIILAASVVLTLSNSGIINKANDAVSKTNLKEVEQLASLTWAEEFMNGKRGDTLKEAVLDKLEYYTDNYYFEVTDSGVSVIEIELNEYGFFYDVIYEGVYQGREIGVCFTKDKLMYMIAIPEGLEDVGIKCSEAVACEYEMGKVLVAAPQLEINIGDNPRKAVLTMSYIDASETAELECNFSRIRGAYLNRTYVGKAVVNSVEHNIEFRISEDNIITVYLDGVLNEQTEWTNHGNTNTVYYISMGASGSRLMYVSIDGKTIVTLPDKIVYTLK